MRIDLYQDDNEGSISYRRYLIRVRRELLVLLISSVSSWVEERFQLVGQGKFHQGVYFRLRKVVGISPISTVIISTTLYLTAINQIDFVLTTMNSFKSPSKSWRGLRCSAIFPSTTA